MGFDDHEESFVTLNNRNFSKLILNQLDASRTQQTSTLIGVKQDINAILSPRQLSDNEEKPPIIKKGSYNNLNSPLKTYDSLRKTTKNLQSLNPSNYEKLTLTLSEIEVEMATTSTKDNFVNM